MRCLTRLLPFTLVSISFILLCPFSLHSLCLFLSLCLSLFVSHPFCPCLCLCLLVMVLFSSLHCCFSLKSKVQPLPHVWDSFPWVPNISTCKCFLFTIPKSLSELTSLSPKTTPTFPRLFSSSYIPRFLGVFFFSFFPTAFINFP